MRTTTALLLALAVTAARGATVLDPAEFAGADRGPWKTRVFDGRTHYEVVAGAGADGGPALRAIGDDAASALYREVEVDLTRTPYLRWSWRATELPRGTAPETEKAGDDYAARVYVVREGLFGRLGARALNYVWSRDQAPGTRWPNAFTGRAILWAVDGGRPGGGWTTHTRDVRADWRAAFGDDIERIDGVALMTDADNTDSRAAALYGRIRFCATPECAGPATEGP